MFLIVIFQRAVVVLSFISYTQMGAHNLHNTHGMRVCHVGIKPFSKLIPQLIFENLIRISNITRETFRLGVSVHISQVLSKLQTVLKR